MSESVFVPPKTRENIWPKYKGKVILNLGNSWRLMVKDKRIHIFQLICIVALSIIVIKVKGKPVNQKKTVGFMGKKFPAISYLAVLLS